MKDGRKGEKKHLEEGWDKERKRMEMKGGALTWFCETEWAQNYGRILRDLIDTEEPHADKLYTLPDDSLQHVLFLNGVCMYQTTDSLLVL